MKIKVVSTLVILGALFAAAPASAGVKSLLDNNTLTFVSTTSPVGPGSYSAPLSIKTNTATTTWQFVLNTPQPLMVAISASASDSIKNDLDLSKATFKLEEGTNVIETLTFSTSNNGTSWNSAPSQVQNLGSGTYDLVFAGFSTKGLDSPSFSGTVAITGVPEVSTWAMMLAGFGSLAFAGYRRRVVA
jgi:hypothetical protein